MDLRENSPLVTALSFDATPAILLPKFFAALAAFVMPLASTLILSVLAISLSPYIQNQPKRVIHIGWHLIPILDGHIQATHSVAASEKQIQIHFRARIHFVIFQSRP